MRAADLLIEEIVGSSQIPSSGRRREVVRELRSHIDDFVLAARAAGHDEDEIERLVRASFGDPRQMGRNFAWVYRRDRAILRLAVFGFSALAVASLSAAGILAVQAGVAAGFGVPLPRTLLTYHAWIESTNIFATAAAYAAILSLERLFERQRGVKAAILLMGVVCALRLVLGAVGIRASFLVFGCGNAVFLRAVQAVCKGRAARFLIVVACFGLLGAML